MNFLSIPLCTSLNITCCLSSQHIPRFFSRVVLAVAERQAAQSYCKKRYNKVPHTSTADIQAIVNRKLSRPLGLKSIEALLVYGARKKIIGRHKTYGWALRVKEMTPEAQAVLSKLKTRNPGRNVQVPKPVFRLMYKMGRKEIAAHLLLLSQNSAIHKPFWASPTKLANALSGICTKTVIRAKERLVSLGVYLVSRARKKWRHIRDGLLFVPNTKMSTDNQKQHKNVHRYRDRTSYRKKEIEIRPRAESLRSVLYKMGSSGRLIPDLLAYRVKTVQQE